MVGIYKITSPSSAVYIGQSWDIDKRFRNYKSKNAYQQPHLSNSIKKYGFDSHKLEVVHELPKDVEQEVLDRYEQIYMDAYRDCGVTLMNIKEGGRGGKHSAETRRTMGDKLRGIPLTEQHKENIGAQQRGKKHSAERIKNMRDGKEKAGYQYSEEALKNMAIGQTGRKHSEESKAKRSKSLTGIKRSEETKTKYRQVRKDWHKNNPEKSNELINHLSVIARKPILQLSKDGSVVIKEWVSTAEAARSLKLFGSNISQVLRGIKPSCGGFRWKYK